MASQVMSLGLVKSVGAAAKKLGQPVASVQTRNFMKRSMPARGHLEEYYFNGNIACAMQTPKDKLFLHVLLTMPILLPSLYFINGIYYYTGKFYNVVAVDLLEDPF